MPRGTREDHSPLAGRLLADRYRLDSPMEAGGMGEVWSARDTVLNRPVAVRLINEAHAADEAFVSRFRAESRCAAALSHSGVAQVFDYGEQETTSPPCPYLVMEHVSGRPLSELIAQAGPLPAEQILDVTAQTARALQAAHDIGITHRNVTADNLLITDDGRVKITDFASPAVTPGSYPADAADAGLVRAAAYTSPERAGGDPPTPASDVYSLGVVAYECATGRLPFPGRTPQALAAARAGEPWPLPDQIPAPVGELIMRMIANDPWMRPGSAQAVAETASGLRKQFLSAPGAQRTGARPGPGSPGPAMAETGPRTAGTAPAPGTGPAARVTGRAAAGPALMAQGTGMVGRGVGAAAQETGLARRGTGPVAGAGPETAMVQEAAARASRHRRRRSIAVAAAAAVGVTALAGVLAAMMFTGNAGRGGNPPAAVGNTDTPGPAAQGVVPALGPTHTPKASARPSTPESSARPTRPPRPRSSPTHRATSSPPPKTTPPRTPTPAPPPTRSPTPTPTPTPSTSPSVSSPGQSG